MEGGENYTRNPTYGVNIILSKIVEKEQTEQNRVKSNQII